jgi:hypothetical protein
VTLPPYKSPFAAQLNNHNSGSLKYTTKNKILLYKTILKPIWTYGIPLWGAASNSNIEILPTLSKFGAARPG